MDRVSAQLRADRKTAELAAQVNAKARELQDVSEAVESAKREKAELGENKARLARTLDGLESRIREKEEALLAAARRELDFIASTKRERAREESLLASARDALARTERELEAKEAAKADLDRFLGKESDARRKYLESSAKSAESEKRYLEFKEKHAVESEARLESNRTMDAYKQYLVDLYGKVASYARAARETVEAVNEELRERGVPVSFAFPGDEAFEITFDNFNAKRSDT